MSRSLFVHLICMRGNICRAWSFCLVSSTTIRIGSLFRSGFFVYCGLLVDGRCSWSTLDLGIYGLGMIWERFFLEITFSTWNCLLFLTSFPPALFPFVSKGSLRKNLEERAVLFNLKTLVVHKFWNVCQCHCAKVYMHLCSEAHFLHRNYRTSGHSHQTAPRIH